MIFILSVSLSTVIPSHFLPIVNSPRADATLLLAVLDTVYQLSFVMVTLQLEAVQVAVVPVYVNDP